VDQEASQLPPTLIVSQACMLLPPAGQVKENGSALVAYHWAASGRVGHALSQADNSAMSRLQIWANIRKWASTHEPE
jgi:hypothetical protein